MTRLTLAALLLATLAPTSPAQDGSVASLVAAARAARKSGKSDSDVARAVSAIRLTEQLPDAVIEQLQTEGAGPKTLDALDRQQDLSSLLPPPASPLHLFDAPPTPSAQESAAILELARAEALQYSAGLPNFLCTETVHRFLSPKEKPSWKAHDWYTLAMAYSQKGEQVKLATLNGKPTVRSLISIGGFQSSIEFGSALERPFQPKSAASFRWERWSLLRGHRVHVFSYAVDQPHSTYKVTSNRATILAAFHGTVYVDPESHQVLRVTHEPEDLPMTFNIVQLSGSIDYEFVDIAGRQFLLPRQARLNVLMTGGRTRNVMEFGDYRKFTGESTLIYDK
jgi:hypothetical protein